MRSSSRRPGAERAVWIALLVLLAGCAAGPPRHAALAVVARFEPVGPSPQDVQPYFANLYAVSLCRHGRHLDEVARYIAWYLDHLNDAESDGLAGTIDDYRVHHGNREHSLGGYDSADGYAGTFLILLDAYEQATGDEALWSRACRRSRPSPDCCCRSRTRTVWCGSPRRTARTT